MSFMPVTVSATTSGIYTYTVLDGKATITEVDTSISGAIAIPEVLDGYPVTSIGDSAFSYRGKITSITIPYGVTSIGSYAFNYCRNLQSITISNSVISIGSSAFTRCSNLENIKFPNSITTIGAYAFRGCSSLKNIKIPNNITTIASGAFAECSNITSVSIGNGVTSIGNQVFYNCTALTNISVSQDNPNYSSVDGNLYNKNKTTFIAYAPGKFGSYFYLPDTVTSIGYAAFQGCSLLTHVGISGKVTSIGQRAFQGCAGLTNIDIPDNITIIDEYAFASCTGIKSITIPDRVTAIGFGAFMGCENLKTITIPNSVVFIDQNAFQGCTALTNVTIPDGVASIEWGTFYNCSSLKSIGIPKSVKSIVDNALDNCTKLETVYYGGSEAWWNQVDRFIGLNSGLRSARMVYDISPASITIEGIYAYSVSMGKAKIIDCDNSASGDIVIPATLGGYPVNSISNDAFSNCNDIKTITIGKNITNIGKGAFYPCRNLKFVYYNGTKSAWKRISIGSNNSYLTGATIIYNSDGPNVIVLSKTNISGMVNDDQTIYVYKFDGITPYDKPFTVKSSNIDVVLPIRNGNEIVLSFASSGEETITVLATDGSGASNTCFVKVTGKTEPMNDYLMERFALNQIVYSDNLVSELTVGNKDQTANKNGTMFYTSLTETIKYKDFYKKYIDDYRVIMLPELPTDGFYAAAFEKTPGGDIVIAYRGSEGSGAWGMFKFWDNDEIDWHGTNLPMVLGTKLSSQFDQAIRFYDKVKEDKKYSDKNITLTGHSLGGALASYVAINRNVKCDNINGATGWVFNHGFLADPKDYPVHYVGFDKTVNENFNGHDNLENNAVTRWANLGVFNYSIYADTYDYNKKYLEKDYHKISSVINYSNGGFLLTSKIKEYSTTKSASGLNFFIGTSLDDKFFGSAIYWENRTAIVPNYGILCGSGNDEITLRGFGGADVLIGNDGDDILNGASGNDTYVYGGDFGNDTIIDPSGNDKIVFADVSLSDLTISGNKITCGSNSITISDKSKRKADFTVVDKNNEATTISFSSVSMFSLRSVDVDATKNVQIFGNATIEIYDVYEELIDTLIVNEETVECVEYKDYGMVAFSSQTVDLTLPNEGYIIKVKSDETVRVLVVSDADNPIVAKQTFVNDKNLSDGSMIVINTGEMVEEQLSVKHINGTNEEIIYTPTPESFVISADKTEIKTGEKVTMSVPEFYAAAVQWESISGNVIITKNDDLSVNVTGYTAGEDTIKAYLPNDELYSAEISIKITEGAAPDVAITSNDESYDGTTTATDSVLFNVEIPEGYDTIVFDTQSPYSQIEDANIFVINELGEHTVNIYCKNSQTGAITKEFIFEFSQDSEAPTISGVKNETVYYTDRIVEVSDNSLDTIYINGELCKEESFIISEVGNYTITAVDTFGNTADASFEIKEMPAAEDIKQADSEMVSKIRNDFEAVKYLLPEERMNTLEASIHQLEEVLYTVTEVTSFTAETTASNAQITLRIANAPVDSTIYVASYNSLGKMLEIQKLTLENGVGEATFSTNDVYNYKAFVWNNNLMPFVNSTECYPR